MVGLFAAHVSRVSSTLGVGRWHRSVERSQLQLLHIARHTGKIEITVQKMGTRWELGFWLAGARRGRGGVQSTHGGLFVALAVACAIVWTLRQEVFRNRIESDVPLAEWLLEQVLLVGVAAGTGTTGRGGCWNRYCW
jgi:hypothetical protein